MGISKPSRRGFQICCGVTVILLIILAIVFTILAFTVFKPKEPEITVYPQGLENITFGFEGFLNATANATIAMIVGINNRNYGSFKFKNTTGFINYRGDVVADVPIQQSFVPARGKVNISTYANFMVDRLISNTTFWADVLAGSVNFTSEATVRGKATVFKILKLHASVPSTCDISIFIKSQSIETSCKTKLKL
ncbi:Late embryogenesis abundant protein, LEA-14 [Corchorus olitorius]|uniref:Late embryogenesis abundant protein, LEA-14 n=1 Tax=Corchorus olitorius TaxID=93759 RepID=A0A1R3HPL3_9ROSI|nr:Late embryogenesis abundant protein, LEA-14 [Corchorus olitorius]